MSWAALRRQNREGRTVIRRTPAPVSMQRWRGLVERLKKRLRRWRREDSRTLSSAGRRLQVVKKLDRIARMK